MKSKNIAITLFLSLILFTQLQSQELDSLFNQINNKIKTYATDINYSCNVISKEFEMDKNWQVKKIKVIEKVVTQKDSVRNEEIIKATEFEKDKEKDITEDVRKEQAEQLKEQEEQQSDAGENEENGRMSLSLESVFPFADSTRDQYHFTLMADTVIDGKSYFQIEAIAKEESREQIEGIYRIQADTYTITYMDLHFSKNPRFVKDLRMKFWFNEFDENRWLPIKIWTHIHIGILIKNIRREYEENHSDYIFQI
ncbi:hypothetical protein JW824_12085 [bacterium]|nr:hypothetical protein [bacterium]